MSAGPLFLAPTLAHLTTAISADLGVVSSVLVLCGEVFSLEVDVNVDRLLGWTSALPGLLMELHD